MYKTQEIPGAVRISYDTRDSRNPLNWLEQEIVHITIEFMTPGAPRATPGDRLRTILDKYKELYKRRALIVVEVSGGASPEALKALLLLTRQLGHEDMRATFVVVAASAISSPLGASVDLAGLLARGFAAPDFTVEDAQRYIHRHVPEFSDIAPRVAAAVGTRAIYLTDACEACHGARSEGECMQRVAAYAAARVCDASCRLRSFLAAARKNARFSAGKSEAFFGQLLAGNCTLDDEAAQRAFGFAAPKLLLAALADYPAFDVDPFDGKVRLQSHFMRIAISEYLAKGSA